MRILAVADLHGRQDRITALAAPIAALKPDVLVVAGDIGGRFRPRPTLKRLDALPLPVLVVRGNADPARTERLFSAYPNLVALHLAPFACRGVTFVGLSGTLPVPGGSRIRLREKRLLRTAWALVDERTVLVAHPPPYGLLDEAFGRWHAGSRGLLRLVDACRPALLLCGHIHERPGAVRRGRTLVVNCTAAGGRGGALVDIHTNGEVEAAVL